MGDTLSKERRNTLTFCLKGEEKEFDECGFGEDIDLENLSLTANSLNYDRLNRA